MNATRSATPVCWRRISQPPYHSTTSTVKPCNATIRGLIMPRQRARSRLRAWYSWFNSVNLAVWGSACTYALTTCIPLRFS